MAIDEFQQIAHARANMMLRGHGRLICLVGPRFFERCFPEGQVVPIEERRKSWEEAIGMRIEISDEMEGFAVMGAKDA